MKQLLFSVFLFLSIGVFAQHNGEGYAPKNYAYGNWNQRARFDSALHIPYKPVLITSDLDTTPQIFVFMDTFRVFINGTFRTFLNSGQLHGTKGNLLYYAPDGSAYTTPLIWDSTNITFNMPALLKFPSGSGTLYDINTIIDNTRIYGWYASGTKTGGYNYLTAFMSVSGGLTGISISNTSSANAASVGNSYSTTNYQPNSTSYSIDANLSTWSMGVKVVGGTLAKNFFINTSVTGDALYIDSANLITIPRSGISSGIVPVAIRLVNSTAATLGNQQYGPSMESEGQVFVSGATQTMRVGWYNKPVVNGSIAENRFTFGATQNHPYSFPLSDQGYVSDNPSGGRIHFLIGEFTGVNLSYQEVSAAYDMGSSGFIYYNVATANTFTITLKTLANSTYTSECFFENYGSGVLTVKGAGSENIIFNGTTANTFTLAQYKWAKLRLVAGSTAWRVIESN
jgi:hypothetical protein